MPVIDGNTGKLIGDFSRPGTLQCVRDRILTRRGSRLLRPAYGTYVRNASPDLETTRESIYEALEGYHPAVDVNMIAVGGNLDVTIDINE